MVNDDYVKLSIDELEAIKSALQLLSRKEQKLMESNGKVKLNTLHQKLTEGNSFIVIQNEENTQA